MLTLGSLFDGIGGFPLAGVMCGITPAWASEIEPFPMKVTAARFPEMKQLGSVTEINGAEIEPVDIITFGSPCQDLSVAGKQLGIHEGQRSNLFFEAVRIIKEMRYADKANGRSGVDIRPRFAVWENVPGAFSSNKGADFKAVLKALASVSCDGVSIPRPKKWNHAGCVAGNGWSIAWRVYNAQYWGVPQRRKRIYLVADFASERAGEILFEREGVSGDSAESGTAWEGTAADAERSVGGGCYAFKEREGCAGGGKGLMANGDRAYSLVVDDAQRVCYSIEGHIIDRKSTQNGCGWADGYAHTLNATDRHGVVYPETARTLTAEHDGSWCVDKGPNILCYRNSGYGSMVDGVGTLRANGGDVGGVRKASSLSVYDARGNGEGSIAPTVTGDHNGHINDYMAVLVEKHE